MTKGWCPDEDINVWRTRNVENVILKLPPPQINVLWESLDMTDDIVDKITKYYQLVHIEKGLILYANFTSVTFLVCTSS